MALELRVGADGPSAQSDAPTTATEGQGVAGLTGMQARQLVSFVRFGHFGSVKKQIVSEQISAPAWLESERVAVAVLYRDDALTLEAEERASFFAAKAPDVGYGARPIAEPPAPWDRSTSRVRFRLDADAPDLSSREPGWIKLAQKPRETLVVPSTAVLESSEGPYVLVCSIASREFAKRPVELGRVSSGLAAIVSGVREREIVVTMNAFFLDAERRLRARPERGPEAMP